MVPITFNNPAEPSTCGTAAAGQRIAMLVPGGLQHAGGIGRWADYMQRSWREQGLMPQLEILDTRGTGHAGHAAAAFAKAMMRLFGLYRAGKLHSIHANLSARGSTVRKFVITKVAAALGVPVTLHLHGSGYDAFFARLPQFWQRRVTAMFQRADRVLVLGRYWADWAATTAGVSPERLMVLHNGAPWPPRPRCRHDACHIVFLGRLGARKGVPELIAALGRDELRARDWVATLAGDGEVHRFRNEVEWAGLADRITLPGWLDPDATADLLASADILVLPSHAENSPLSIIEALAAGVAVVATPVGTTSELLEHEHSALLMPVGDADALTAALVRLCDDRPMRERIGAAGRAVFAGKLEISGQARRLAALHDALRPPC